MAVVLMDGPMGTELLVRGVETPIPLWSAAALETHPETVGEVHRAYADAGAIVHTANTFRTQPGLLPDRWEALARRAVQIARLSVPDGHRVAGSIAPIADCYRPDLSPRDRWPEHELLARVLADEGVDILLCETFPLIEEAIAAAESAVRTGRETWVSFTAGPDSDLLTPAQMAEGARRAISIGASAVLVNCVPAPRTLEFVAAIAQTGARTGAYANAGAPDDRMGWSPDPGAPERYADLAEQWIGADATIIGGCCGTGPAHIAEIARRLQRTADALE